MKADFFSNLSFTGKHQSVQGLRRLRAELSSDLRVINCILEWCKSSICCLLCVLNGSVSVTEKSKYQNRSTTALLVLFNLENYFFNLLNQVKAVFPCRYLFCQPESSSVLFNDSKIIEPKQLDLQQLTIRNAELKDLTDLTDVLAYSFYEFPQFLNWLYSPLKLSIYEDLRNRFRTCPPHYRCLVASLVEPSQRPIIVGTVEISLRYPSFWSNERQYPYISNLAVARGYRRQGVAQKLLANCEQIALDWGYQESRLHVLEENQPAKQLYFQRGYQIHQQESSWRKLLFYSSQRLLLSKQLSD